MLMLMLMPTEMQPHKCLKDGNLSEQLVLIELVISMLLSLC